MSSNVAKFQPGQLVHHCLFDYRGVVLDVDATFQGSEEWYVAMAKSRPPKDAPWYHVLVHDAAHRTYVAERNLEPDDHGGQIRHPEIDAAFDRFEGGAYVLRRQAN